MDLAGQPRRSVQLYKSHEETKWTTDGNEVSSAGGLTGLTNTVRRLVRPIDLATV